MKLAAFLTVVALVPAYAQIGGMKQAAPAAVAAKPTGMVGASEKSPLGLQALAPFEKDMDSRLSATGANDPCVLLGQTRGLYVNGFGMIFTSEVDLVNTPGGGPFQAPITPELKALVRKRKLAHVAQLQQTMREMVLSLAAAPSLKLADSDQIVLSVRMVYRPWEDTTGLPGQIVARADRRGNSFKSEIQ